MEFTEAFRAEDISKTDFFDIVVSPEDMGNDILHSNFPWARKSMGIFGNSNSSSNNNNNNNGTNGSGDVAELRGIKETNNNHLLSTANVPASSGDSLPSFGDHTFWNTSASAKAAAAAAAAACVKMETSSLEDLNEICWSASSGPEVDDQKRDANQRTPSCEKGDDTDGAIYTLTVINGGEPPNSNPTWYRPPDLNMLKEDEEIRHAMSSIDSAEQYHTSLDIESIISILPSLPTLSNESHSDSLYDQDGFHKDNHNLFTPATDSSTEVIGSDLLGSSKLHSTCDDSGFVESKDDMKNRLKRPSDIDEAVGRSSQGNGSCTPVFSENNNDWTFSNNESRHNAESLLRSALQGGKSFINQYNGCAQHQENKTLKCLDTHTELQNVYPTSTDTKNTPAPPDHASLGLYMTNDVDGPTMGMSSSHSLIPVTMDNGSVLIFDDGVGGNNLLYSSSQASSTSQSMDDILLSPLEDYEKLKMIEDEVAESAKRYTGLEHQTSHVNGLGHAASPYGNVGMSGVPISSQPQSSTPPKPKKKSSKKSGDRSHSRGNGSATTSPTSVSSVPTSGNGARRERSLHHCTICSKAFKDKYSVNVHIRTHTGEKPFACSVCGKSFRQKAHLAKHYHTHIVQKTAEPLGSAKGVVAKSR